MKALCAVKTCHTLSSVKHMKQQLVYGEQEAAEEVSAAVLAKFCQLTLLKDSHDRVF